MIIDKHTTQHNTTQPTTTTTNTPQTPHKHYLHLKRHFHSIFIPLYLGAFA